MALPLELFDYALPPRLIAQRPVARRDASRLLVLGRDGRPRDHARFADLPEWLRPGDAVVLNDSRVRPARLLGVKEPGGGQVEVLLLGPEEGGRWSALVKSAKRPRGGFGVRVAEDFGVRVLEYRDDGTCAVAVEATEPVEKALNRHGRMPLPPYITREADDADRERYQTVYADRPGSVAAPTAGLHFTEGLLAALEAMGVAVARLTLDVGLGTFQPIRVDDVEHHRLHAEAYRLSDEAAAALNERRAGGGKIVAVGTTATRVLETVADEGGRFHAGAGWTRRYLRPGVPFRGIDGLITNFHLPRSSLLVLVAAFVGREPVLDAYRDAVARGYRFHSYGDAMMILPVGR